MLTPLDPLLLESMTVLRDDADPHRFYWLPDQPRVPLDDQGKPDFLFIRYINPVSDTGDAPVSGGGYLHCRLVCTLTPEAEARLRTALRGVLATEKSAGKRPFGHPIVSDEPILASPTWMGGETRVITFAAGDEGPVRHAATAGKADLSSDLATTVVVHLSPEGADVFWDALSMGNAPVVIGYDLRYLARLPAGRMTIRAQRDEVVRQIYAQAIPALPMRPGRFRRLPHTGPLTIMALRALRRLHGPTVRALLSLDAHRRPVGIERRINSVVEVEIETGEAASSELAMDLRAQMTTIAGQILTDSILPGLLAPQPPVQIDSEDGTATVLPELEGLLETEPRFELTFEQNAIIERPIHPNGPLSILVDPALFADRVLELNRNSSFFATKRVTASVEGVDFEADGIESIEIQLHYGDQPLEERRLDANTRTTVWRFSLRQRPAGGHDHAYRYRTQINYVAGVEPTILPDAITEEDVLTINPRALDALRVAIVRVAAAALGAVTVDLAWPADGPTRFSTERVLTQDAERVSWFQHTGAMADGLDRPQYRWRARWRLPEVGEIAQPWQVSQLETLTLLSPFERTVVYRLQGRGFASGVTSITGTLRYTDAAHDYAISHTFRLTPEADEASFDVQVFAGAAETAQLVWTAERVAGAPISVGPIDVQPGWVPTGPEGTGGGLDPTLEIIVDPSLIDFEADVRLAIVRLRYTDVEGGLDVRSPPFRFDLDRSNPETWTVDLVDPSRIQFHYDIRYIGHDRATDTRLTGETDDDLVLLDRAPPA